MSGLDMEAVAHKLAINPSFSLVKQVGTEGKHLKCRHFLFERLWHTFKSAMQGQSLSKRGLGFQDGQVYECHMMSAIDVSDRGEDDPSEDAANDHPT